MEFHLAFNTSYLIAFIMGLFSSLHCIGMCGSIIGTLTFSLPVKIRTNKLLFFKYVLNYNLGRISSYALAGAIMGAISGVFEFSISNGYGHRFLQLLSAIFMLSAGLYIAGWLPRFAYIEKTGAKFWRLIEPFGHKLIPIRTRFHALLFGMIWGWMPCGLVYTALMLATTTGDILKSSLTMLAFGLGTLPAVMGIGIMTQFLTKLSRMPHFESSHDVS